MAFDLQPVLRGARIELRPLLLDDFSALFEAASDPSIWEQHPEPDRYKREVFEKFFDSGIEGKAAFAVVELKSGRVIGSSRYYDFKPNEREIRIGYTFLQREFWGGSINREMKALMLSHAFRFVDRVLFDVGETNVRSQKALRKIGARLLSQTVSELPSTDGTLKHNLLFGISRVDWKP